MSVALIAGSAKLAMLQLLRGVMGLGPRIPSFVDYDDDNNNDNDKNNRRKGWSRAKRGRRAEHRGTDMSSS